MAQRKNCYKLSGYDEKNEAWCWRKVDPCDLRAGSIFRVKLGGMSADDVRDSVGNYVFIATENAKLIIDDNGMDWAAAARPATENDMRESCGLSTKAADGGIREGMPEA